ncbi:MAG: 4Fe-4S dicluster domain-containing protein [Alphaproteobacteria bacterium]|nr:4Fe-4S dicluster domain-containing protein [Alphaproteobacteria bacterium]
MDMGGRKVLLCDCAGSMPLDAARLGALAGAPTPEIATLLCRRELTRFKQAAESGEPLLVACTQEAPLFAETAPDADLAFVNIRETAAWSKEGKEASPKIHALLAAASVEVPPTPSLAITAGGRCLVYGRDEVALEAGRRLADKLDVTVVLLGGADVAPPRVTAVPLFSGTVAKAQGSLGDFRLVLDGHAEAQPQSRETLAFGPRRDGVAFACDSIVDLSGGAPLFPGDGRRDGYVRADPKDPVAVERALAEAAEAVGDFEKPLYVDFISAICAHARSQKTGCARCLAHCPTGAIAPAGDSVGVDPRICAGCGQCAAVCPTGASAYAFPKTEALLAKLRTLLLAYRHAGGRNATLLLHDEEDGAALVEAIGRFGDGLPADALPFAVHAATGIGLDVIACALAWGAGRVIIHLHPRKRDEAGAVTEQIELAEAILAGLGYGDGRVILALDDDPEALTGRLAGARAAPISGGDFLALGGKRSVLFLALRHLHAQAPTVKDVLTLPEGAPFGGIEVKVAGCTLCLSCVGACPTGALTDNPEKPMLRFKEEACIQCGLCRATCPENVIALAPRLDFTTKAKSEVTIKEEEPFKCVRCAKPFGAASTVEKMAAKLASHPMFAGNPKALDRIRMCENCRVIDQFEANNPLAGNPRPVPRTTEDYLPGDKGKKPS